MEPAPSVASFAADWVGRYVVGRTFVLWCWDASFGGSVFWGVPDLDDVRALASIYSLAGDTGQAPTHLFVGGELGYQFGQQRVEMDGTSAELDSQFLHLGLTAGVTR